MTNIAALPVISPTSDSEWEAYYHCRWLWLRQPWQQPIGSEKDEFETQAIHKMIVGEKDIIAIGRLHLTHAKQAQIRFMAVAPDQQRQGYGQQIILALETAAQEQDITSIVLQARDNAVGFYQKMGYQQIKPSFMLYGSIRHYLMQKKIKH